MSDSRTTRPPTDLSGIDAKNIAVVFRPALPGEIANAEHAYIDITRADGSHQTLGAYPVGGTYKTGEGGQLTFEAGQEKPSKDQPTAAQFDLHAPPGMTLTQYANELVRGAKAYNAHALRYDGLGENGVNSNSFVSSLVVAKGGATGLADVRHIAAIIDTSPVRTPGQPATMNDEQAASLVARDLVAGRIAAPGFGNATIEPQRFTGGAGFPATAPPWGPQLTNPMNAGPAAVAIFGKQAGDQFHKLWGDRPTEAHGATPPYFTGGTLHVRRDGQEQEVGPGYRQSGTILSVRDGVLTQRTGRGIVEYHMSDLTANARDPAALEKMLVPGRDVRISVGTEYVQVQSLDRNHDIDRAQQHARQGHSR